MSLYLFDAERAKVSMRTQSLHRGWFTMLIVRLFMKRMLEKENNREFRKLDQVLKQISGGPELQFTGSSQ